MFSSELKIEYPGNLQLKGVYVIGAEPELSALTKLVEHINDPHAMHRVTAKVTSDGQGSMFLEFNLTTEEHLNPVKEEAVAVIEAGKQVVEHAVALIKDAAHAAVAGAESVVGIGSGSAGGEKPLTQEETAALAAISGSGGMTPAPIPILDTPATVSTVPPDGAPSGERIDALHAEAVAKLNSEAEAANVAAGLPSAADLDAAAAE